VIETRQRIVDEARSWLRTPWHHEARVRGAGVDCAMLLAEVYHAVGVIPKIDPSGYSIDFMVHRGGTALVDWLLKFGHEVDEPKMGDVVTYLFGRTHSHTAIVIEWPARVIHAYRPYGMVIETHAFEGNLAGRDMRFFSLFEDLA
jgi:cell wall-associated NlpC family hydrolase